MLKTFKTYNRILTCALSVSVFGIAIADQLPGVYVDNPELIPPLVEIPAGCVETGTMLMNDRGILPGEVCVEGFAMTQYEIRYAEFEHFLADRASPAAMSSVLFKNTGDLAMFPVTEISWFEAMEYAIWLSNKTGRTFRLPTEEEWEYAARAGMGFGAQYSWGNQPDPDAAHCLDCSTHSDSDASLPSGQFAPNAFGLYDMHGNVAEWTIGCYHGQDEVLQRNRGGRQLTTCRIGVVRGGSWRSHQQNITFWVRSAQESTKPAVDVGFRLLMETP
ncbi:formylglycine-generating enzyme family protein [Pseudohongiella spirulinae]|uniref:Sulfatase-modifying factor enzyme-like domain-containing protein n=1 Tax=Pseudohongiella spirulinae TaxID=1249552 RepID=A0A0S2KGW1_9GAMM|nr:SUMF1/EgtB/PvdO family nonheme iron enzyme [Pseudohongiella spirulinae]ALO47553.1 hypothetical protein PS2015_2926 [Pseudohongiella spirulinae]